MIIKALYKVLTVEEADPIHNVLKLRHIRTIECSDYAQGSGA